MPDPGDLRSAVKPYEKPIVALSLFQLVSSVGLFIGASALMYWSLQLSYLVTLLLAIPTGALLVRVFIIQHDCGHGSFFGSRRANDMVGWLCSAMTLTPRWRGWKEPRHEPAITVVGWVFGVDASARPGLESRRKSPFASTRSVPLRHRQSTILRVSSLLSTPSCVSMERGKGGDFGKFQKVYCD